MGWQQHHLHLFGNGEAEYGDNARDETKVTLAALIPRAGDWLGYRYDFGDMCSVVNSSVGLEGTGELSSFGKLTVTVSRSEFSRDNRNSGHERI
jgi:hypothetical protein